MPKKGLQTLILEFVEGKKYFSIKALKAHLGKRKPKYDPLTINQYLYNLHAQKKLFDAGRGWYSTMPNALKLDPAPVRELASNVKAKFPLLSFSCWGTEQIQSFAHHLQTSFVLFLYAESDAIASVTEYLVAKGYNAYHNPGVREFEKYFKPTDRSVILRPSITEEPVENHYATIEKILVDLYLEKDRANLMDGAEYKRVFKNLIYSQRINIARLLRYAQRRKVKETFTDDIFAEDKNLIAQ
ncbi:MAG: DUF6577 family protein [Bacteroidota bacterium]